MRLTTTKFLPSEEVKVTIEKTTYIFLPTFPLDIDFTEDKEPDTMDPVSVQIQKGQKTKTNGNRYCQWRSEGYYVGRVLAAIKASISNYV